MAEDHQTGHVNADNEPEPESTSRGDGWFWLCCFGIILALYILSSGPFWLLVDKKIIRLGTAGYRAAAVVYWPMGYACDATLLRKPLFLYWHMWAPGLFDGKGNIKRGP